MAAFDEEAAFGRPTKAQAAAHAIGENVDALSAPELAERIELCRREIERLEAAKAAREATKRGGGRLFQNVTARLILAQSPQSFTFR